MPDQTNQPEIDSRLSTIEATLEVFASQLAALGGGAGQTDNEVDTESYRQREEMIRLLERIADAVEVTANRGVNLGAEN
jgi:hypothetical protein